MPAIRPVMRKLERRSPGAADRGAKVAARTTRGSAVKAPTQKPPTKLMLKGYPRDWARISRRIRFERARGICEQCGKQHGELVNQGPQGCWQREAQWFNDRGTPIDRPPPWPTRSWWRHLLWYGEPPKPRRVKVVLHTAHLDHNPANCTDENLAALCQQCHLRYDTALYKWTWGLNRDKQRGQRVLALAPRAKR